MITKSYIGVTPEGDSVYRIGPSVFKESNGELQKLYDQEVEQFFIGSTDDFEPEESEYDPVKQWDELETQLYGNQRC